MYVARKLTTENTVKKYKICSFCEDDNKDLDGHCFDCNHSFCTTCLEKHGASKLYKNHVVVAVNKESILSLVCSQHNQFIRAFCTSCDVIVCQRCVMMNHNEHNVEGFKTPGGRGHDFYADLNNKGEQQGAILQNVAVREKECKDHVKYLHQEIANHKASLIQQIEKEEMLMLSQLDKYEMETHATLDTARSDAQQWSIEIEALKSKSINLQKCLPEVNDISTDSTSVLFNDIRKKTEEKEVKLRKQFQHVFSPSSAHTSLGELICLESYVETAAPKMMTDEGLEDPLNTNADTYKGTSNSNNCEMVIESLPGKVTGVCCLSNGFICIVVKEETNNQTIQMSTWSIYTLKGELVNICQHRTTNLIGFHHPSDDLCVTEDNHFHSFKIIHLPELVLNKFVPMTLNSPQKLNDSKPTVAGTRHRVTGYGSGRYATAMTFTTTGDIIVSSAGGSGFLLLKYNVDGSRIWKKSVLNKYHSLVTDGNDRIIGCDGGKLIDVYSPTGRYLQRWNTTTISFYKKLHPCALTPIRMYCWLI